MTFSLVKKLTCYCTSSVDTELRADASSTAMCVYPCPGRTYTEGNIRYSVPPQCGDDNFIQVYNDGRFTNKVCRKTNTD